MNKKQKSLNNKGFSLVELIIVIAIMAVLVGVLAPTYLGYVEKSKKSTDVQNAQELATSIAVYATDHTLATQATWADVSTGITGGVNLPDIKNGGSKWQYKYDGKVVSIAIDGTELYPNTDSSYQ